MNQPLTNDQIYFCELCNGPGSTKHHLVPKSVRLERGLQANAIMRACGRCHSDIHYYISNWELATQFNSPEKIKLELKRRKLWPLEP